jgi:hypothetical protein
MMTICVDTATHTESYKILTCHKPRWTYKYSTSSRELAMCIHMQARLDTCQNFHHGSTIKYKIEHQAEHLAFAKKKDKNKMENN